MNLGDLFSLKDPPIQLHVEPSLPMPPNAVRVAEVQGHEGISQLYSFQVEVLTSFEAVPIDQLLGRKVTIRLRNPHKSDYRLVHGVCIRVTQGERIQNVTRFHMEVVPRAWRHTRRVRSRIFQHKSVLDILKKVLHGFDLDVKAQGDFPQRDFVVQYRESDFQFASRLMEEEGIFYYFTHDANGERMVLGNSPIHHAAIAHRSTVRYHDQSDGASSEERVFDWSKDQTVTPGKYTLWDHHFELPDKHLEASKTIQDAVVTGQTPHRLRVWSNEELEIFDYPGEYAQRFDGIDAGGGERQADLQHVFKDNRRTAEIRMQQEAVQAINVSGGSDCPNFATGHRFTLDTQGRMKHADGAYVLTSVTHRATLAGDKPSETVYDYDNGFQCIPILLPYAPPRLTSKPVIQGVQTAVVVGPAGEEIFCDKYGRVKVQFRWDQEGKNNADSSCWIRVASTWAGKQWGAIQIPRIGQEVIVAFEEGDPDQPIIVGSVYNAENMPPLALPEKRTQSGLKSRSTPNGQATDRNELTFEDKKGDEDILFHAQKDFHRVVGHNDDLKVKNDQTIEISQGNQKIQIKLGKSETEALESIELKVGQNSIMVDQKGITLKGLTVNIEGTTKASLQGLTTQITGPALLKLTGLVQM